MRAHAGGKLIRQTRTGINARLPILYIVQSASGKGLQIEDSKVCGAKIVGIICNRDACGTIIIYTYHKIYNIQILYICYTAVYRGQVNCLCTVYNIIIWVEPHISSYTFHRSNFNAHNATGGWIHNRTKRCKRTQERSEYSLTTTLAAVCTDPLI